MGIYVFNRDTLVEALSYWVVVAQKTAGPQDRLN